MGTEKKEGQSNGNIMHRICRVQGYVVCLSFPLTCTLNRSSGYVIISSMEPQLYFMITIPLFTHRHNKHMHSDKLCELQS